MIPRPLRLPNRAPRRAVYLLGFAVFTLGVWAMLFGMWLDAFVMWGFYACVIAFAWRALK